MGVWRTITGLLARLLPGAAAPLLFASASIAPAPDYPALNSLSTLARFPWIWTAVQAIASDMAGTPIVAVRRKGRTARRVSDRELVDDPTLDLLEQPSAGMTGYLLLKQLWVDALLTGNAYLWRPSEVAVYRLHPSATRVLPGPFGSAAAYEHTDSRTGQRTILPVEQVTHIRDVSWQDNDAEVYGESPIRCLHDDLTTDLGRRKTAAEVGARRTPDLLFSVKDVASLGEKGAERLIERWQKAITQKHGAFVTGGDVTATPLSFTPKDLAEASSEALRDETLAVFGVPPTRAGLTTASYGASRQEMRVYWEGLVARGKLFTSALSRLARPGTVLEYDYSSIEALQVSYTERQHRVEVWVSMGASPKAAAEYEGFDEAPVGDELPASQPSVSMPIDRQPEEPRDGGNDARVYEAIASHLQAAQAIYAEAGEADTGLLVRWQTERLFASLVESGVVDEGATPHARARWWAEEICAVTDEGVRMGMDGTFGAARARVTADQIRARRAA